MFCKVIKLFKRFGELQTIGSVIDVPEHMLPDMEGYIEPVVGDQLIVLETHTIGDESVPTVNARKLHAFLEVSTRFNDWIKRRIEEFGFTQGIDFTVLKIEYANGCTTEYFLTLDMAKHISMAERNEQGKKARMYFIECERKVKQLALPSDPILASAIMIQKLREEQLALASGQEVLSIGLSETRHAVSALKQNMRIENWQQVNLQKMVAAKVDELRSLYPKLNRSSCFREIYSYLKRKFRIPRYNELPMVAFDEAVRTVSALSRFHLPGLVEEETV